MWEGKIQTVVEDIKRTLMILDAVKVTQLSVLYNILYTWYIMRWQVRVPLRFLASYHSWLLSIIQNLTQMPPPGYGFLWSFCVLVPHQLLSHEEVLFIIFTMLSSKQNNYLRVFFSLDFFLFLSYLAFKLIYWTLLFSPYHYKHSA